jgi:hypothetical protein
MLNQTWAMDFVNDQLAMGKKIRALAVIDIFSKFSPVIDPRFSYRAADALCRFLRSFVSSRGLVDSSWVAARENWA